MFMIMTDLWYIKRNDFLCFETLECPEIVLKFTKKLFPDISILPAGTPDTMFKCLTRFYFAAMFEANCFQNCLIDRSGQRR